MTAQQRGETVVRVAAAKQVAVDVGLEIGNRVFEVTGARHGPRGGAGYLLAQYSAAFAARPGRLKAAVGRKYALLRRVPEASGHT